jgi:RNA polymerase sigma-70 factor (ECF subfamily)
MPDQPNFADFLHRIRQGDQQAASELVHRYESLIRREVRLQLEDQRLRRLFDSMDVCQSVLASFFVCVAAGQYDWHSLEPINGPEVEGDGFAAFGVHGLAPLHGRTYTLRRDAPPY